MEDSVLWEPWEQIRKVRTSGNERIEGRLDVLRVLIENSGPAAHKAGGTRLGVDGLTQRASLEVIEK